MVLLFYSADAVMSLEDAESLYRNGVDAYRQEQYRTAEKAFRALLGTYADSQRFQSAQVLLAKSLYRLGDFAEADTLAKSLRASSPKGPYLEWTYYFESACALRTGNVDRSLSLLAWLSSNASDPRIRARSLRALKHTVMPLTGPDRISETFSEYGISRSMLEGIEPYDARDVFEIEDDLAVSHSPESATARVEAWKKSDSVRIGLLVPLSGPNSEMGKRLLRGAQAAFGESSSIEGKKIELLVEDTRSDPVEAVIKVRKLVQDGVVAIIGPVYSVSSITAAVESNASGIPFLAPTATDTGLTGIGERVFQLNFTPEIQAETLADFAVNTLAVQNVAVIASRDFWGQEVAEAFVRSVAHNGVNVVKTAFFESNFETDEDNRIIRDIRARAPRPVAFTDSVGGVTFTALPDTAVVDSTHYTSATTHPIDTVDAVFISATPSDAIRFATRITELNLVTVLLGDSGWNYPGIPEDGKQYVDGAYLVAPPGTLSSGLGPAFLGNDRRNDDRDTVAMKSHDAVSLLLQVIRNGNVTPDTITGALAEVRNFQGASSYITIDPKRRQNTAVGLVRIHDRRYEPVGYTRRVER